MHLRLHVLIILAAVACRPVVAGTTPAAAANDRSGQVSSGAPAGPVAAPAPTPTPPSTLPARRPIADHVIILSEDGLRPDALANAKAPHHDRLMREGAYALHARTIRMASTLPSHAAMLSGFDVREHGLDWNSWRPERGFIKVPTVFTAVNAAGKQAAVFVGKRKLEHITQPGEVTLFSRPGFFCKKVSIDAAAHFAENHPQVEFVHFSDPDESGHHVGWMTTEQLTAIAHSDACLGTLLGGIGDSAVGDRTLLIISSDHGGEGQSHSGSKPVDRLIPWIVWGAGVKHGHRIQGTVSTMDTAATALWALGYDAPPGLGGRPVTEAFETPLQQHVTQ